MRNGRFALTLLALLFMLWAPLAIAPWYREDWLLENVLLGLAIAGLAATWRMHAFSRVSYVLICIFLCLHTIGAHYTYAEVPYDAWMRSLTGRTFNSMVGWERNNFDRVVHVCYGLLLAYPVRELLLRAWSLRGFPGYLFALDLTMSSSMLYELIEWAAATLFGGELGMAYLGTQGDVWDAHKDMALASIGALVTIGTLAVAQRALHRDFAAEWVDAQRSGGVGESSRQRPGGVAG
jgi:putative membrane protein